jgi:hypothetical protein
MTDSGLPTKQPTRRKPSFPVGPELHGYLHRYKRERELPVTYERLRAFHEVIPLTDDAGRPTLWDTVIYEANEMTALNEAPLRRPRGLLHLRQFDAVPGPHRQCVQ